MSAIETFVQDARYGIRTLLRAPGFTAAVLLTLALGTGANTAVFSVVNTVLLRPLPYPDADRIVQLVRRQPTGVGGWQTGVRYFFFRDHMRIGPIAASRNPTGINLVTGDSAEFVRAMPVSKEYFDVFGVRPALGGSFTAEQDRAGGPLAAVLSDGLWRRQFGANPAIVGTSILLGESSYVVVGVMPASFAAIPPVDLYVPLRPSTTGPGGGFNYGVTARLPAGATLAQVNAEAAATWEAMGREHPQGTAAERAAVGLRAAPDDVFERCPPGASGDPRGRRIASDNRVREHREPSAGARVRAWSRDRGSCRTRCRPRSHHPSIAHGKRPAFARRRIARHRARVLGDAGALVAHAATVQSVSGGSP